MYLSRLLLNPRSRAVSRDMADCQELHRTIMSAFPSTDGTQGARERFGVLHRLDTDRRRSLLVLLVQSLTPPDWSRLPTDYLLLSPDRENPAVKSVDQVYQALEPGKVLSFRLRANPSRKIDTKTGPDGIRRHGRRVELVQEEQQISWLQRKGVDGGFKVLSLRVGGVTKEKGQRRSPQTPLTLAGVLFEGLLQVTDPQKFMTHSLARGIGPGKAYGLGLLSLAPP
jgi:CRISPR system Cascade subunit CasE